ALPDLQRRGPHPLPPRVEHHHAAVAADDADVAVPRGDAALAVEGHAVDPALPDLQRRGARPLPPRVAEHDAAAADADDTIPRGDAALAVEGHAGDPAFGNVEELGDLGAIVQATLEAPARFERVFFDRSLQGQEDRHVEPFREYRVGECSE